MQTINVNSWEEFEGQLKLHTSTGAKFLFRGQGNSSWLLETTLERCGQEQRQMLFKDYYRLISAAVRPQIEASTAIRWDDVPSYPDVEKKAMEYLAFLHEPIPAYSYMAYLRHHGFPSPLLDWTRTPHVAAYFAFREPANERVAIYVYSERPETKSGSNTEAAIRVLGQYVSTHRRNFLQQSEYTVCLSHKIGHGWSFAPHEGVFTLDDPNQDLLWKFTLPSTERLKVLKRLDAYNLNAYSLFESEESLMETIALREIDFKR